MLENGYEIIECFVSKQEIADFIVDLDSLRFEGKQAGIRNLEKKSHRVNEFALSTRLQTLASTYLFGKASLVRAIYFNKTESNNWLVTWHQDKTVAVTKRFESPNWGPWSSKDNYIACSAPCRGA